MCTTPSTRCVTLPSTSFSRPRRPCEPITMRSAPVLSSARRMPSCTAWPSPTTVVTATPASAMALRVALRKIGPHAGEGIGVYHVDRRHGAAKGLGQPGRLGHGQHRGVGTIDWNQNVLEHGASPWVDG